MTYHQSPKPRHSTAGWRGGLGGLCAVCAAFPVLAAAANSTADVRTQATAAPARPSLKMYTTRHYAADQNLISAFTKATGVVVQTVTIKDASALVARVIAEKDRPQADLVLTTDTGNLLRLAQAGVFQRMDSTVVPAVVPQDFRDSSNDLWTGVAMRVRVIAYNKATIKPEQISTIESLASPSLKGKVLVRPSHHVYNQSLAATLLAAAGPQGLRHWAQGVTANLARKPQGGDTDQLKAIAAGEGDVAIVNSYYVARLMDSQDPKDRAIADKIGIVFPNQGPGERGAHVNVSGIGIIKGTEAVTAARSFIDYLVSPHAQQVFASASKEYPVREDVPLDKTLRSWERPQLDRDGLRSIARFTPEATRILDEVGWR